MYIEKTFTYYKGTEQHTTQADFLILIQKKDIKSKEIKAVIRKVALHQLGNFMSGYARIGNKSFYIEGSYGNNGLPLTVDDETFNTYGLPLPQYLYDLWAKGEGCNSCGNEAGDMRKWARENIKALKSKTRID